MRSGTELPRRVSMGEAVSVEVDAGKEADLVEGQAVVAGAQSRVTSVGYPVTSAETSLTRDRSAITARSLATMPGAATTKRMGCRLADVLPENSKAPSRIIRGPRSWPWQNMSWRSVRWGSGRQSGISD